MRHLRFWISGKLFALAVVIEPPDALKMVSLTREDVASGMLGPHLYGGPARSRARMMNALRDVTVTLEAGDGPV